MKALADIIVNALGIGLDPWCFVPPLSHEAWEKLALEAIEIDNIVGEMLDELEKTLGILSGVKEFKSPVGSNISISHGETSGFRPSPE